jgi:hypothetical protein
LEWPVGCWRLEPYYKHQGYYFNFNEGEYDVSDDNQQGCNNDYNDFSGLNGYGSDSCEIWTMWWLRLDWWDGLCGWKYLHVLELILFAMFVSDQGGYAMSWKESLALGMVGRTWILYVVS